MGVERDAVNVSDLKITRPTRTGPGGDSVGADADLGVDLEAAYSDEEKNFRRSDGREVVTSGLFVIDPILDDRGEIVPVLVGDLATWTDHQGVAKVDQEIVRVKAITDCTSRLDVISFSVGQQSPAGA